MPLFIPKSYIDQDPLEYFYSDDNAMFLTYCIFKDYGNVDLICKYIKEFNVHNIITDDQPLDVFNRMFLSKYYNVLIEEAKKESTIASYPIIQFDNQAFKLYTYGVNGELQKYNMTPPPPKQTGLPISRAYIENPTSTIYERTSATCGGGKVWNIKKINNPIITKPIRMNVIREDNFDSNINKKIGYGSSHLYKKLKNKFQLNSL
jgi:hypothetical protein